MAQTVVIGAGPAGLMAAEQLARAGHDVLVAEAKPSVARKFLMAGKSGLNLTRLTPDTPAQDGFLRAYGPAADDLRPMITALPPQAIRTWAEALGQPCFTGSTGRLFPKAMKASPLLRAWLARLHGQGVQIHTRWRWLGWDGITCQFDTPEGPKTIAPGVTVLALGGASWARLGSDGLWADTLRATGIVPTPFAPANAGLSVPWSDHMIRHFGAPLKSVRLTAGHLTSRGEIVVSTRGLEGGGLYPLTPALRDGARLCMDLRPDLNVADLAARLAKGGTRASLSNRLRRVGLGPAAIALAQECHHPLPRDAEALAQQIKALHLPHATLR
ncbi:MAG: TIGR03862 family flavoprotein, partial [Primorskyibacter sp.]